MSKSWFTDGSRNIIVKDGESIPEGFYKGRTVKPLTEEEKNKIKEKRKATCLERFGVENPFQSKPLREKGIKTSLEKYGTKYPAQSEEQKERTKKTCLQKYGTEYPTQSREVQDKVSNTFEKKYGVKSIFQAKSFIEESKDKRKKTNLKRYGAENPSQNKEVHNKKKQTCLKNYGVEYSFQMRDRMKKSFIERYGVDNPAKSEEIKKRVSKTCQEKYGVPWSCMRKEARLGYSNDSVPNKEFASLLDKSNIAYEREFSLGSYIYDFKINTTLIEINPYATHNTIWSPFSKDSGISIEYHKNKSLFAEENGYHCIHVFDWDNKEKIIKYLSREEINLDNTSYTIEEACPYDSEVFLSDYCFYSYLETSINIGLYTNNEVIAVLSALELDSETFEIISYCSKYKIQNGLKILLNYLIQRYHPKNILAFQDKSKFNNNAFMQLGFYLVKQCEPELVWYMPELNYHCTSEDLNEEYLLKSGYLPIPDCGKDLLIFNV